MDSEYRRITYLPGDLVYITDLDPTFPCNDEPFYTNSVGRLGIVYGAPSFLTYGVKFHNNIDNNVTSGYFRYHEIEEALNVFFLV